ncbi:MAG: nucleotidyltransferase family protein [bacterium]
MQTIDSIKKKAAAVLPDYGVTEAYLFGSLARGDGREDSDVDILVRFDGVRGLFAFVAAKLAMEEALGGCSVDLVQIDALRPEFRADIEREKIRLF